MTAYPDIVDLREFYASPLGHVTARLLSEKIVRIWPEAGNQNMLAFGYALPVLQGMDENRAVFTAMPAGQGVCRWPREQENRALLVDDNLPFPDSSFARVILMHGIEHAADAHTLLREMWRVLVPGGRMLCLVSNRRGLWARRDATPFGWGQPYSGSQLRDLLRMNNFAIERVERALYMPPFRLRFLLRTADLFEKWGDRTVRKFGGVLVVEASKQLYAPIPTGQKRKARQLIFPVPVST